MKKILIQTSSSWAPFILRVVLGLVILPHGAQKLLGWFGGYGFKGTMHFFTDSIGLPWVIGFAVIVLEFLGAIALIAGLTTRLVALAFTVLGFGIMITSHVQNGFFMNWLGNQNGEGVEYFVFWVAISISLIISGGGRFSIDNDVIMHGARA